jgi:hypothetical protein
VNRLARVDRLTRKDRIADQVYQQAAQCSVVFSSSGG